MELYKRFRPEAMNDVIGQDAVVDRIVRSLKDKSFPHAAAFVGPSGTGKTSVARIVMRALGANEHDLIELNCADVRGIDAVRDIRSILPLSAIGGGKRGWIIDEAHKLTKDAQNAMLKMLEDTPPHVYFIFCTTDPKDLIATVKSRLAMFQFHALSDDAVTDMLKQALAETKKKLSDKLIADIVEACGGNGRSAFNMMEGVLANPDNASAVIRGQIDMPLVLDLCQELIKPKPSWSACAKILRGLKEEPETVRRSVLGYMTKPLLDGHPRAERVVRVFQFDVFHGGMAALVLMVRDAVGAK